MILDTELGAWGLLGGNAEIIFSYFSTKLYVVTLH